MFYIIPTTMEQLKKTMYKDLYCSEDVCLNVFRRSLMSADMDLAGMHFDDNNLHTFVTLGASGNLASHKIYPSLWRLYHDDLVPSKTKFIGFSRTKYTAEEMIRKYKQYMKVQPNEEEKFSEFCKLNAYLQGHYDKSEDYVRLNEEILKSEEGTKVAYRIFHLALPPFLFGVVCNHINRICKSKKGWTRVIIEKPFGRDLESATHLSKHLSSLFTEQELYRIDHYLGKEMVQSIVTLRFANRLFSPIWNRDNISCVFISFKENIGTQGRGGYFNEFGIIRDVMQNHLMQILTLIAMEKPVSLFADDIRDEKVKVMKSMKPINLRDTIVGQYTGDPDTDGEASVGYLQDPDVPINSHTPTYAMCALYIDNERWEGVPFIMEAGKAVNERKTEVRIQFSDVAGDIFHKQSSRNELVINVQPHEAVYMKVMVKTPTQAFSMEQTVLDLTYSHKFANTKLPDAYERLILDVFCGCQMHFVRTDELTQAWRIFTPLLYGLENQDVKPIPYKFGSLGPEEACKMLHKHNLC